MKILFNLLFLKPDHNRGTETYCRELVRTLIKYDELKIEIVLTSEMVDTFRNIGDLRFHTINSATFGRPLRVLYEQVFLSGKARSIKSDILFCPGYMAPMHPKVPTIIGILDTQFKDIPSLVPRFQRLVYNIIIPRAASKAAAVITISEYSRRQILHHLKIDPEKVFVTHLAARNDINIETNKNLTLNPFKLSPKYILSVSGGGAHKNIYRLCSAFMHAKKQFFDNWDLVFVGQKSNEIINLSIENKQQNIRFLGYVSKEELASLYKNAGAFILASLYEGFGLPILEAMSVGVPVACSNTTCLPEIAGNAAIYFDPTSEYSIAESLVQMVNDRDLRQKLKCAGYKNANRFSWEKCASETRKVFLSIMKKTNCVE